MSKKFFKCLAVTLIFVMTLLLPVSAFAATGEVTKTVKGTKVTLSLPAEKGVVGDNNIKITLTDKKTKKVITGSTVSIVVDMDSKSMDSMNMTTTKTVAFKEGKTKGEYTGTVNFTDEGKWKLKVSFTTGSGKKVKTNTTTFVITTKKSS